MREREREKVRERGERESQLDGALSPVNHREIQKRGRERERG